MDLSVLHSSFTLSAAQISSYQSNGFLKIKEVIPPEIIDHFNGLISDYVSSQSKSIPPLAERNTYGKAFIQLCNLWVSNPSIKELVFSKRLAGLAADLMQVDGVRIYHDQALFKEAGGGITPWHADQRYWPLSSSNTVTVWIPLQPTPLAMGPLEFCSGSQHLIAGREHSISDNSEIEINKSIKLNNLPQIVEPFDIGEVSYHSGWVFHRAGANTTDTVRKVMTVIYIDKDITLKKSENSGQENDRQSWCPGVAVGEVVNSPLNPILFTR